MGRPQEAQGQQESRRGLEAVEVGCPGVGGAPPRGKLVAGPTAGSRFHAQAQEMPEGVKPRRKDLIYFKPLRLHIPW